jgi:hypothetical protein
MVASIRAALPRQSLRVIEELAGLAHREFLARLGTERLGQIRGAGHLDWLPIEIDLDLCRAVAEVLGPEVERERGRRCVRTLLDTPLLRPFIAGVDMLFGLEPAALIGQVPRGWHAVYREAGRVRYEVGVGLRRSLVFEEMPPNMVASGIYLEAIAGALHSLFDLCRVEGSVEVVCADVDRSRVEFEFCWL